MKSIETVMKMLEIATATAVELALCLVVPTQMFNSSVHIFVRHQLQLASCKVTRMVKLTGAW